MMILTSSASPEPTNHVCFIISYHCHLVWLQSPLVTDMEHWGRVRFAWLKITSDYLHVYVQ